MITIAEVDRTELPALFERCAAFVELDPQALNLDNVPPGYSLDAYVLKGIYEEGRLVGIYDLILGYPKPNTWWIGELMLEPAARGRELGREIVDRIAAQAEAAGVRIFWLSVHEQNEPALRFWSRLGFVETGRDRPHIVMRRG